MRRADDIPAALINLRIGVAEQFGGDRSSIIQEAKLSEELLSNPTNRISVEDTMNVWQAIVDQTGSHDIGLISGSRMRLTSLGILGYLMMNSQNMDKGLEKLCVHQRLINSISFLEIIRLGSEVKYQVELQVEWTQNFRYTIDFMMAALASIFKDLTHVEIKPKAVGFSFEKPENVDSYKELFKPAAVAFNCANTYMVFSNKDLEKPIIGANSKLFNQFEKELEVVLESHDDLNKYTRIVKEMIHLRLKAEIPSLDEVAREIGVSTRSLQAFLKKEKTSFQSILNEVRKDVSINQLKNKRFNITEVAFLTGFSDISVFSRSFKKWTGLTPTQFQLQYH